MLSHKEKQIIFAKIESSKTNKSFILFPLLIAFFASLAPLSQISTFGLDRFLHFFVSLTLFTILFQLLPQNVNRWIITSFTVLCIGLLKESFDPSFDCIDLFANLCGIGLGFCLNSLGFLNTQKRHYAYR